jgi:ribonuclease P protein component
VLKKQFRLSLRHEKDFFSNCKKVHTPYFSFFYKPSETFLVTVVVSKKVALKATARNAIKRKFNSILENLLITLITLKIKLVIVVHQKSVDLSVNEIAQQIENNVQKIRI